jgi:hypothetical protein
VLTLCVSVTRGVQTAGALLLSLVALFVLKFIPPPFPPLLNLQLLFQPHGTAIFKPSPHLMNVEFIRGIILNFTEAGCSNPSPRLPLRRLSQAVLTFVHT